MNIRIKFPIHKYWMNIDTHELFKSNRDVDLSNQSESWVEITKREYAKRFMKFCIDT